ncbi:MAG TPA: hypothetical protein VF121_13190 [Thermoanaerobaculia bacterium]|nr:hypothetical protein [Thermoanaerobaculia bacterium]
MRSKSLVLTLAAILTLLAACSPREEAAEEAAAPAPAGDDAAVASPTGAAATDPGAMSAVPPTTGDSAAGAPTVAPTTGAAAGPALASQETNWPGIVVEVTEFLRKGNTLTAKLRVRNQGGVDAEPDFTFSQMYVMDAAGGRKYEVLKDEKGTAIAGLRSGWSDRWYDTLSPGESAVVWMKFPAPPPEVKVVTLQIPNTPPFDDLAIQDS